MNNLYNPWMLTFTILVLLNLWAAAIGGIERKFRVMPIDVRVWHTLLPGFFVGYFVGYAIYQFLNIKTGAKL